MDIETDVLVVGGGVAGCSTAYYLAREGVEVVLIDRGDVNAEASGANAGSIHAQMYYHNFNTRSAEWIAAFAPVLPLLKLSSEVWRELAAELDSDIELVIAGGLMVAETAEQLRLLERKVAFENAHGTESTIISASELATLAPYISDRMIGAEFCPYEGKVNPLLATAAIASAAKKSGARIQRLTALEAWAPTNKGFEAHTNRGRILCRRAVIAAGGWCESVAALLGISLPAWGRPVQLNATEPTQYRIDHLVYSAGEKLSFKQAMSGNLIIGGGWPATFNPATGVQIAEHAMIEANLWTALQVVPDLAHLRLIRTWTGMVNQTPDARPLIGPVPGFPGLYVNTFPGMGYTTGPCCGKLVAEAMCGKTPSFDIAIGAIERFVDAEVS